MNINGTKATVFVRLLNVGEWIADEDGIFEVAATPQVVKVRGRGRNKVQVALRPVFGPGKNARRFEFDIDARIARAEIGFTRTFAA